MNRGANTSERCDSDGGNLDFDAGDCDVDQGYGGSVYWPFEVIN